VWVRREDRVLQAVSHYRARNTNQWVRPDGDPDARRPDPPYDADEIERSLRWLTRVDRGWERFFARAESPPFIVVYERLAADPNPILRALGDHLGVPVTATLEPRLERQGTTWSTEMRDRYIAERGAPAPVR
jgi:LPS sulfotransferase NodH